MSADVSIWRFPPSQDVEFVYVRHLRAPVPRQVSLNYKFVYFEQGTRRFYYRRRCLVGSQGSLLLILPDEVHSADMSEDPRSTLRILSLPEEAFAYLGAEKTISDSVTPHFYDLLNDPYITHPATLDAFHSLHRAPDAFTSTLEQQSVMLQLLTAIMPLVFRSSASQTESPHEEGAIRHVKEYLDAYYPENITLEQLAQMSCLVPAYLCRAFTKAVGMPPHAYQNALRIAHARKLLGQGCPVGQVAQVVGFYDQAHFTRHFSRAVMMPPARYARQVKNVQDKRRS